MTWSVSVAPRLHRSRRATRTQIVGDESTGGRSTSATFHLAGSSGRSWGDPWRTTVRPPMWWTRTRIRRPLRPTDPAVCRPRLHVSARRGRSGASPAALDGTQGQALRIAPTPLGALPTWTVRLHRWTGTGRALIGDLTGRVQVADVADDLNGFGVRCSVTLSVWDPAATWFVDGAGDPYQGLEVELACGTGPSHYCVPVSFSADASSQSLTVTCEGLGWLLTRRFVGEAVAAPRLPETGDQEPVTPEEEEEQADDPAERTETIRRELNLKIPPVSQWKTLGKPRPLGFVDNKGELFDLPVPPPHPVDVPNMVFWVAGGKAGPGVEVRAWQSEWDAKARRVGAHMWEYYFLAPQTGTLRLEMEIPSGTPKDSVSPQLILFNKPKRLNVTGKVVKDKVVIEHAVLKNQGCGLRMFFLGPWLMHEFAYELAKYHQIGPDSTLVKAWKPLPLVCPTVTGKMFFDETRRVRETENEDAGVDEEPSEDPEEPTPPAGGPVADFRDQAALIEELVAASHDQTRGHVDHGIRFSGAETGIRRERAYPGAERGCVWDLISDFTRLDKGVDLEVDSAARLLKVHFPERGTDRSATHVAELGVDAVDLSWAWDEEQRADVVIAIARGSETGSWGEGVASVPSPLGLEAVVSAPTGAGVDTPQALADGVLRDRRRPLTVELSVHRTRDRDWAEQLLAGDVAVGDLVRVRGVFGVVRLDDVLRIVGWSVDPSAHVAQLQLARPGEER